MDDKKIINTVNEMIDWNYPMRNQQKFNLYRGD